MLVEFLKDSILQVIKHTCLEITGENDQNNPISAICSNDSCNIFNSETNKWTQRIPAIALDATKKRRLFFFLSGRDRLLE